MNAEKSYPNPRRKTCVNCLPIDFSVQVKSCAACSPSEHARWTSYTMRASDRRALLREPQRDTVTRGQKKISHGCMRPGPPPRSGGSLGDSRRPQRIQRRTQGNRRFQQRGRWARWREGRRGGGRQRRSERDRERDENRSGNYRVDAYQWRAEPPRSRAPRRSHRHNAVH